MRKNCQIILLLIAVFLCATWQNAAGVIGNEVGNEAPDFSLPDTDSQIVTLSTHRQNEIVILIFYRGQW